MGAYAIVEQRKAGVLKHKRIENLVGKAEACIPLVERLKEDRVDLTHGINEVGEREMRYVFPSYWEEQSQGFIAVAQSLREKPWDCDYFRIVASKWGLEYEEAKKGSVDFLYRKDIMEIEGCRDLLVRRHNEILRAVAGHAHWVLSLDDGNDRTLMGSTARFRTSLNKLGIPPEFVGSEIRSLRKLLGLEQEGYHLAE